MGRSAEVIVIVSCGGAGPVYLGKRHLDWDLANSASHNLDPVRGIRVDVEGRVRDLIDELSNSPPP